MKSSYILLIVLSAILLFALFTKPCMFGISAHNVKGHEGFNTTLKKENADHVDKQDKVDVIAELPTTSSHNCVSNGLVSSEGGAVCLSGDVINLMKSRGGNL